MTLSQRIDAFVSLGEVFRYASSTLNDEFFDSKINKWKKEIEDVIAEAHFSNPWFVESNVRFSIRQIGEQLRLERMKDWLNEYLINIHDEGICSKVAIIMAGNVPLVGFYDMFTVLITGNIAIVKESAKDSLIRKITSILIEIQPEFSKKIHFEESVLTDFDAVIATGSNNTKRYFDYYFSSYPSIIRGHRNSVAVLNGDETEDELIKLMDDVFLYFGLGCRNVSKVYVPKHYDIKKVIKSGDKYVELLSFHSKYFNNYEYYKSIYLVNKEPFLDSGFFMFKKDNRLASPISVVYYDEYNTIKEVENELAQLSSSIQCVVSNLGKISSIKLGEAQIPKLNDYADGIDVLKFCIDLKKTH